MKKASVITMHRIYNYGSVLQTYATQKILESIGLECEILDYISPYRTKKSLFLEYPPNLEGKIIKKIIYYILKVPSFIFKEITFHGFIKKYLKLSSSKYITNLDILKNPPKADIFITGSDQVWNSKYNHGVDFSYYLNFAQTNTKKIAFVSSFGRNELTLDEANIIKSMLKEYSYISVREDSAVNILSNMEISSLVLIDPTLQLKKQEWVELASAPLVKKRYLLLFLLYNEDNGATEYAKKIAKKKGLILVKLSWELKKPPGIDILFTHRKPQDFLSLFINADYIVTNSFHGVAFSINFSREFIFVPRSEFNGRIESLLRLVNLENRKISNLDNLELADNSIDFTYVNNILQRERKKASNFLSSVI